MAAVGEWWCSCGRRCSTPEHLARHVEWWNRTEGSHLHRDVTSRNSLPWQNDVPPSSFAAKQEAGACTMDADGAAVRWFQPDRHRRGILITRSRLSFGWDVALALGGCDAVRVGHDAGAGYLVVKPTPAQRRAGIYRLRRDHRHDRTGRHVESPALLAWLADLGWTPGHYRWLAGDGWVAVTPDRIAP